MHATNETLVLFVIYSINRIEGFSVRINNSIPKTGTMVDIMDAKTDH